MVAAILGTPLMEWQQYVADVILELDPETNELIYDRWVLTVPRQSGKTTLLLAKNCHRAMATKFFGHQEIAYAAQTKLKAAEKFEKDYQQALRAAGRSHPQFKQVRVRTGNQKVDIRFPNGSTWAVDSGTEKSGHGGVLGAADVDEAFAQPDSRLETAFVPAMNTRPNSQYGLVSTMGWSDASPYFNPKVDAGRALAERQVRDPSARTGTAYFEWSAEQDADPSAVETWLSCMPAVHRPDCDPTCKRHTTALRKIQSAWQAAQDEGKTAEFRRSYLNQRVLKPKDGEQTALGNWAACAVSAFDLPEDLVPSAIGVAVSLGHDFGSIGAFVADVNGRELVAAVRRLAIAPVTDGNPSSYDVLASEAVRIQQRYGVPIAVADKGPGAGLIRTIQEMGGSVTPLTTEDYIQVCDEITQAVSGQVLAHPNHPDLNDAVQAARWKPINDRRVFGRKHSVGDISMLEAVACAKAAAAAGDPSVWVL